MKGRKPVTHFLMNNQYKAILILIKVLITNY